MSEMKTPIVTLGGYPLADTEARKDIALAKSRLEDRIRVAETQVAGITMLPDGDATVEGVAVNVINAAKFHEPYGNTAFYSIKYPQTETHYAYKGDGTRSKLDGCTRIMPCPEILGFNLKGNTRMYLYIGDLTEEGEFIPDDKYRLMTTSSNVVNYLNPSLNRILSVEPGKYFYYCVSVDEGYELIGADEWPESPLNIDAHTPFYSPTAGDALGNTAGYDSVYLPSGCYYALLTDVAPVDYARTSMILAATVESGAANGHVFENLGVPSFGYIGNDHGATLLRLPDGCTPADYKLYIQPKIMYSASTFGHQRKVSELASKLVESFAFKAAKDIKWSDSTRVMYKDKRFFGVPYSSRWKNSHFVGFEISPETALNALNDEYSIAYDDGSVSGITELSTRGGPGYGLVCSAMASLIHGCPYPQTNRGYTFDSNFEIALANHATAGALLLNDVQDHIVQVDEVFHGGYTLYEAVQPCCVKTVRTGHGEYNAAIMARTKADYLDDYPYTVSAFDRSGYSTNFTTFENIEITNGPVRPWRGNKCVYGPWDKSALGSGIGVTIHDGATAVYLIQPGSGEPVSIPIPDGAHYLDISSHVNTAGTYELYSDVSDVREYFRYYQHDDVTLSFDTDGTAKFSAADVLYAFVEVRGYGGDYPNLDASSTGPMVVAAGKKYPALATDTSRISKVYAAIIADPDGNPWGRYSVPCKGEIK